MIRFIILFLFINLIAACGSHEKHAYRPDSPGPSKVQKPSTINGERYEPLSSEFDSSYKSDRPTEFRLNNVIKCWKEGLQMMKVGGKAELVCPSNIAYGEEGIVGSVP